MSGAPGVPATDSGPGRKDALLRADRPRTTTGGTEGLLVPVEGREGKHAVACEVPVRTQTGRAETALVVPYYGTGRAHPTREPLHTVSTRDRFGVAFIAELRGGASTAREVAEPLATVTAGGYHHMLIRTDGTRGGPDEPSRTPPGEPARTITTAGHQSLTGQDHPPPPAVEDCTFRMLSVPEISGAMAFTTGYHIKGTKREQVRQLGNAVTPPAAEWLIRAVVASLDSGPHQSPTPASRQEISAREIERASS